MASFALDFALKNLCSLSKWTLEKSLDTLAEKAAEMAIEKSQEKVIVMLEASDYEILQQVVEILRSDGEKLALMITKQAKATLSASYSHLQRGLLMILDSTIFYEEQNIMELQIMQNFASLEKSALEDAKKEFKLAYSKASDAYPNENLPLLDRIFALKIILFTEKLLYEKWPTLWRHEIENFFRIKIVSKAIKNRARSEFDTLKILASITYKGMYSECKEVLMQLVGRCPAFENLIFFNTNNLLKELKIESSSIRGDIITNNERRETLLHYAAERGLKDVLKELLLQDCDINAKSAFEGRTALHNAANSGSLECLKLLLLSGADANSVDDEMRTPLHDAVRSNHLDCLKELIAQGANVNAETKYGVTPLHFAACNSKLEYMQELIAHDADVNAQNFISGDTALHRAVSWGNVDCVKYLIEFGADPELTNNEGETALAMAMRMNITMCIECLQNVTK